MTCDGCGDTVRELITEADASLLRGKGLSCGNCSSLVNRMKYALEKFEGDCAGCPERTKDGTAQ